MGSMGSVQFQIVPCSSLYLFSRSIGPLQCLVNVNYRVLICCTVTSRAVPSSLFILASSVCKSLQCLIPTLTQRVKVVTFLGLLVQLCYGEGGACKQIQLACVKLFQEYGLHWVCQSPRQRVLPRSTLLRPRVLCRALSQVGLEFHALPRSKPLRFSGTVQGHRLGCECILCPS